LRVFSCLPFVGIRRQFNELKRLEEQIHQQRLKNIEAEKQAKRDTDTTGSETTTTDGGGAGIPRPTQPQPAGALTINVRVDGSLIGGTEQQLAAQLFRLIKPQMDNAARRAA